MLVCTVFVTISVVIVFSLIVIFLLYVTFGPNDMQVEDAKYLKKKVKSRSIDVHPTENALIVNYEIEALILGQSGDKVHGNKKICRKVIRLRSLNSETDCSALAKEVIYKCDLIHPSKLSDVEQLIFYLKSRRQASQYKRSSSRSSDTMSPVENSQIAVLNCVDEYVELLYEDIPDKIKGSALILQLARIPDNLMELARNEALLSALSRVLREEWKRSLELSTNIVYTFFCFSSYNEFHNIIIQYKIGSLCMDVIDYELKRYDQWKDQIDGKVKQLNTPDKAELPKSRIPEPKRRPKSGTWAVADVGLSGRSTRSLTSSYHEELCSAGFDNAPVKSDEEQLKRKLKALAKRQEQLLRVAFYLLLNIADNIKIEEKMHKKDIVRLLIGAMQRHSNLDLLILITSFLQKLSVYGENKNSMASFGIIEKLAPLLDTASPDLLNVTLKLLFNLTFDAKLRNKIIKAGLLPKLTNLISDNKQMIVVMKILYHLSMDDRVKILFTQTDCVKLLIDMLLMSGGGGAELTALCVNLAASRRCAMMMVGEGRLGQLVARAFRRTEATLMKLVRNLSQHLEIRPLFVEFTGDIAGAVTNGDANEEFVVECLGTLCNILTSDIDILAVAERYNLIPYICNLLDPESPTCRGDGNSSVREAQLRLEGVVLAGTLAADPTAAAELCAADAPARLVRLLRWRQSDDEHVLQTIYAFRSLLAHPLSANHLVQKTEAPAYLIDLMQDNNPEIRKLCESCLDIIADMESDWASRIKVERFRSHNGQWLNVIEELTNGGMASEIGEIDGGDLPPYLSKDYLTMLNLFPSGSQSSLNDDSDSLSADNVEKNSRPQSRLYKEMEDPDFTLMKTSGLLTKSLLSTVSDSDPLDAIDFPISYS